MLCPELHVNGVFVSVRKKPEVGGEPVRRALVASGQIWNLPEGGANKVC